MSTEQRPAMIGIVTEWLDKVWKSEGPAGMRDRAAELIAALAGGSSREWPWQEGQSPRTHRERNEAQAALFRREAEGPARGY